MVNKIFNPIPMKPHPYFKKGSIDDKKLKPYGDADFDGSRNEADCNPRNPAEDGFFGDVWERFTDVFDKKDNDVPQLGTVYLKPEEETYAPALVEKTDVIVKVPETDKIYEPEPEPKKKKKEEIAPIIVPTEVEEYKVITPEEYKLPDYITEPQIITPTEELKEVIKKDKKVKELMPKFGTVVTPVLAKPIEEQIAEQEKRLAEEERKRKLKEALDIIPTPTKMKTEYEKEQEKLELGLIGGAIAGYTPTLGGAFVHTSPYLGEGTAVTTYKDITRADIEKMPFAGEEFMMSTIEKEIAMKQMTKEKTVTQNLQNKYGKQLELQSTFYINKWDKNIENGSFTGTQTQFNQYLKDYEKQTEHNKKLSTNINKDFQDEYNRTMTSFQTKELAYANKWMAKITKKHRRSRAWTLVPFVFAESYLLGMGVVKGIGMAARFSPALGEAVSLGVGTAFIAPAIVSAPAIVKSYKEDPLSFVLETAPVVTGFMAGATPGLGKTLKSKTKSFIEFEKKLLADTRGMSGQALQKQKVKTKAEQKITFNELKSAMKRASKEDLTKYVKNQIKIIDKSTKSPTEKLKAKENIAALVLESRTGVAIFDEFGRINKVRLNEAVAKAKGVFEIPKVKIKPLIKTISILKPKVKLKPKFKVGIIPKVAVGIGLAVLPKIKEKVAVIPMVIPKFISKEALRQKKAQKVAEKLKIIQAIAEMPKVAEVPKLKVITVPKPVELLKPIEPIPLDRIIRPKPRIELPKIKIPQIWLPKIPKIKMEPRRIIRKRRIRVQPGYNVYGKPIRQKKYKKLNKVPLTQAQARDFGAYIADHSLSTNFKIKSASKKAQTPKTNFPIGYYARKKKIFRDYRIVKGKKVPMKNKWIERKGVPRLNTRSEIKRIGMLKKLKEVRKRPLKKVKKRKVTKKKAIRKPKKRNIFF